MGAAHHVYLIPGMFGFSTLAGYDYFGHLEAGIARGFEARGQKVVVHVVASPPTSGIPERARVLARTVHQTSGRDGSVHLVGHSTGGIDARLLLSPTRNLGLEDAQLAWTKRVRTVISVNTPHYGTPLATYFTTVAGTRALYALSLLTVISLSVSETSLAVFSRLLASIGGIDQIFSNDFRLISRATDLLLKYVERDSRGAVHNYLDKVRADQGGIIQITPEAMDLFNAAISDNNAVRYGCIVAASTPKPKASLPRRLVSPYAAFSAATFGMIHKITAQKHERYDYAQPSADQARALASALGTAVDDQASDGVVPTLSMLYGDVVWCGHADHLDVLGHFADGARSHKHTDWMTSSAQFGRQEFAALTKALTDFQLRE